MQVHPFFSFKRVQAVLVVALLGLALFLALNRFFDHDEFEAVHTAWKMMHGERIYIDFANQHHPLFYYVLMPFLWVFGETTRAILIMRAFMWLMYVGLLLLTYRMARRVAEEHTATLSALLLGSMLVFLHKAIEIRPDVPQVLFGTVAFLLFAMYIQRGERNHLFASAIFMGISFLFLQKALFVLIVIGAVLLYEAYRAHSLKDALQYAAVVALVQLPYVLYLIFSGASAAYIEWAWVMNIKLNVHFPAYPVIAGTLTDNAPVWLFYAVGLLFALKNKLVKVYAAASIALLASVLAVPAPSPQYFMAALPFVAIVAATGLKELCGERERMFVAVSSITVLIPVVVTAYGMANAFSGALYNTKQLERINYVLSVATPADYVYDGDIQFNVYRKDLDFFWFSVSPKAGQLSTYQAWKGHDYDIVELIDEKRPKIISDYTIKKSLGDPRIVGHYTQSEKYGDIYIRQ